jgi:hypothetical protein
MLKWIKGLGSRRRSADDERPAAPAGGATCGKYLLLYKYLENRYATTVVLTFSEIEDLLGFTLPAAARLQLEWWTTAGPDAPRPAHSDSWTAARRSATPNLLACTVVFERAS